MSEFYDEYTDEEEENISLELSKTGKKYQKMLDEILEETKELETNATLLKKTEEVLTQAQTEVKKVSSSSPAPPTANLKT